MTDTNAASAADRRPSVWLPRGFVLAVTMLASCSTADNQESEVPAQGSNTPAESSEVKTNFSFDDLETSIELLERYQRVRLTECMEERGYDQFSQAMALARDGAGESVRATLQLNLLEFGPATSDQARTYGLVGSPLAFDRAQPGSVLGGDETFNGHLEECSSAAADGRIDEISAAFTALSNRLRDDFVFATNESVGSAIELRLTCLADEYPSLDVAKLMSTGEFTEILRQLGITPGEMTEESPTSVPGGNGLAVVAPPPPAIYTPSSREIDVALTYVECGKSTNFEQTIRDEEQRARAELHDKYLSEISGLHEQFQEVDALLPAGWRDET